MSGANGAAEGLDGWTPIRVRWRGEPVVEWCWMDGITFDEPFFVETVERALRRPYSLLFRRETPIDALAALPSGLEPDGFICHVSRCGSTLVAGMLATVPRHLVLSEPIPVDDVLRGPGTEAEKVRWLRRIVSVLGRPRRGDERAYIVKLDAWSSCSLRTVREAFPDVPWVFLSREPVEVLASHRRRRGAHLVPGALDPAIFGLDPAVLGRMSADEYSARVLGAIYRAGLEHRDGLALFVDYRELPAALFTRILPHLGLDCTEPELARMAEVARFDAKNPRLDFSPPADVADRASSAALAEAADRWVRPAYDELLAC